MANPVDDSATTPVLATDDVTIDVPGAKTLDGPPRVSFVNAIRDYAKDVLKEASNLESAHRAGTSKEKQFTSAHIERAVGWVRDRGAMPRPRRAGYFIGRIAQSLVTLFTGIALTAMTVSKAWVGWGYLFAASLAATVMLTIFIEYLDWKDRSR